MLRNGLLTSEFAQEVMGHLVITFFSLRPRDLREWEIEAEDWVRNQDDESSAWEYSIRACSEKLFLDLVIHYKGELVPHLLHVLTTVTGTMFSCSKMRCIKLILSDAPNDDIYYKDSIYSAIGIAAPVLEQQLDFGRLLRSNLVTEAGNQQEDYRIIRRRIAILLGQWLPVKDGLDRSLVYEIFQHLLNKEDPLNDLVVRLTAGMQFKNVLEPFEFTPQGFMPFAGNIIVHLMSILHEVEYYHTKAMILETLGVIVRKLEHEV